MNAFAMRSLRLFGATLASDFPFASRLCDGHGAPDLTFSSDPYGQAPALPPQGRPIGNTTVRLFRTPDREILRFTDVADFHLWPDRIIAQPADPEPSPLLEIHLLGSVFSYWLERQGLVTLHASAVAVGPRAAAFLSTHGGGKSGLAAALMRAGASLLTDDVFPLEERNGSFLGRPGYLQMRMWPDEATHFLGGFEHLPLVHPDLSKRRLPVGQDGFGTFCDDSLPLGCLYLLERQPDGDAPIEIREVSPRDALIELLRHSFTPLLVEAAGLQPARFDLLSRLVLQVPVKRLRYPSGFDHLPRVAGAVRRDFERC
jgi:hypothetical protein